MRSAQAPHEPKYDNNRSLPAADTPALYETVPAGVKRILDAFLSPSFACNVNAAAGCGGTESEGRDGIEGRRPAAEEAPLYPAQR